MAEPKTKPTGQSVQAFLGAIEDPRRRQDCQTVLELMQEVTGAEPRMWGSSIVGFGEYSYRYASGREGIWPLTGFAPRKRNLTLYITSGFDRYDELLGKLGKYKTGVSCLYVTKLQDIDLDVLRELVRQSTEHMAQSHQQG